MKLNRFYLVYFAVTVVFMTYSLGANLLHWAEAGALWHYVLGAAGVLLSFFFGLLTGRSWELARLVNRRRGYRGGRLEPVGQGVTTLDEVSAYPASLKDSNREHE